MGCFYRKYKLTKIKLMRASDYFKKKEITPESGIRFLLSHDIKIYPVGGVVVVNRSGVQIFGSKEYRNNKELNKGIESAIKYEVRRILNTI